MNACMVVCEEQPPLSTSAGKPNPQHPPHPPPCMMVSQSCHFWLWEPHTPLTMTSSSHIFQWPSRAQQFNSRSSRCEHNCESIAPAVADVAC
eukprot:2550418-Amphidinium_carterae.1